MIRLNNIIRKCISAKALLLYLILVIIAGFIMVYHIYTSYQYRDKEIGYMIQAFNWRKGEEASHYKKMMIRILQAYSYKRDYRYRKSMTKEQKIAYINFNWKASRLMKISPYIVPQINKQETAFNPNLNHAYGETGLGGVKFNTALLAHKLLEQMPGHLKRFFYFNIRYKRDLKDPIVNNKVTYILLWYNLRKYSRMDWAILVYRWGGFYARHWNKGEGNPPESFTLNGIRYNTYKYYFECASYVDAYENGLIEPNRPIKEKWIDYMKKLRKEEIDYRKVSRIIRKLRSVVKDQREMINDFEVKDKQLEKELNKFYAELKVIGGEARKQGWPEKTYNKLRRFIKKMIKMEKK